jgi:hypothetical protein
MAQNVLGLVHIITQNVLEVKAFLRILRNRYLDNTPPECYNLPVAELSAAEPSLAQRFGGTVYVE